MAINLKRVIELYGETHEIHKAYGTKVDLGTLKEGQSVCMGDGKSYHWILTEKKKVKKG